MSLPDRDTAVARTLAVLAAEVVGWEQTHPDASLSEAEDALATALARSRAELLGGWAQAQPSARVKAQPAASRPCCPDCGTALVAAGRHRRTITLTGDQPLELERDYARCPQCGRGLFPLDEQLALGPPQLAPRLVAQVVLLGTLLPFTQASAVLAHFTGVRLSAETVRRLTETAGALAEALDTAAVVALERTLPAPPADPSVQLLSVDGAMVSLVGGAWAEVKTLAIGAVQPPAAAADAPPGQIHTRDLSYCSRLTDADSFARWATVETHRRGTETAATVVAVTDGSEWCQGFIDLHRPDAVRVLDAPHALGYLAQAAQAGFPADPLRADTWLAEQTHDLLTGDPDQVLDAVRALHDSLATDDPASDTLRQVRGYFEPRRDQMRYAAFRAAGYPIGSGCVESANKLVVEARLKGSGMHWARTHVTPLATLRCCWCNGRWAQTWPAIWTAWRAQAPTRSQERRAARHLALVTPPVVEPLPAAPPSVDQPPPTTTAQPRPKLVVNGKPTANHPWRTKGRGLRDSA